jgi:hypothetical protein
LNETPRLLNEEIAYMQTLISSLVKAVNQGAKSKQTVDLLLVDFHTIWFYRAGNGEKVSSEFSAYKISHEYLL